MYVHSHFGSSFVAHGPGTLAAFLKAEDGEMFFPWQVVQTCVQIEVSQATSHESATLW